MRTWSWVALVVAVPWIAEPAAANNHDRDCMLGPLFNQDAGDNFLARSPLGIAALAPAGCTGEVQFGNDDHDWYKYDADTGQVFQTLTVTVCPTLIKTVPGDVNVEAFLQWKLLPDDFGAGIELGASTNPGAACDSFTKELLYAEGLEISIHVERFGGDALYNLRVALS